MVGAGRVSWSRAGGHCAEQLATEVLDVSDGQVALGEVEEKEFPIAWSVSEISARYSMLSGNALGDGVRW